MQLQRALATAALTLVAACSSSPTILTSLEDLTSEADRQGLSAANQNRILSITGLLPQAQVGTFYRYDSNRSPSTAIGISDDVTFLVETTIPGPSGPTTGEDSVADKIVERVTEVRSKGRVSLEKLLDSVRARTALAKAESADPAPDNLAELRTAAKSAKDAYDDAREEFDAELLLASKLIKDSGFIVIRWDANNERSASGSAAPIFSASGSESSRTSGFAILSGLRLTTLFVGPDILEAKRPLKRRWNLFASKFPWLYLRWTWPFVGHYRGDYRLTTHLLQTRRVQYFQDAELSREVSLAIEASYEQLQNLSKALKEVEKVEAAYVAKSLSSLSNFGSLDRVQRSYYPAPLAESAQILKKRLDAEIKGRLAANARDLKSSDEQPELTRADALAVLGDMTSASESSTSNPFRSTLDLDSGKCLGFTGRCIEEQIVDRVNEGLPALTQEAGGWLTIYAVDVDADALCREFRTP